MKKAFKGIIITLVAMFVSAGGLLFFSPKPVLTDKQDCSHAIYDESSRLLRLTLNKDEKFRLFTPLNHISKSVITGTLLQEDQWFYWHYGVNPGALLKAAWQTYLVQSRRMGASTITMQLARIRYNLHSKSIAGKFWQVLRALQIERHYSKDQILEAYLNLAPYGGNIEGVGAASLIYFKKPTDQLTLAQALTLSVIPQNPGKRTPNNNELHHIRDKLFARWLQEYPQDADQSIMFRLPLAMHSLRQLPFAAPHFVNRVLNTPGVLPSVIETTLDYKMQRLIEHITRQYLTRKKHLGVHNTAVLLIDSTDMSVKGLLGSADFFDRKISGQINGVETHRSPGSTLKPFIYGLALDQGLIHPGTVLKDVPHSFNGYNPENFDYDFMGPIKARDALVLSRNIPAIYLSSLLHNPTLYQLLEEAQVGHLRSESYYGLSLNLGGVELTMQELVGLYAMLANEGLWYPVRYLKKELTPAGRRLLSPEASFLVLDMLKNTPQNEYNPDASPMPVSWKTGTSSGYRDAWTVGRFGPYVLAVWLGNFDNSANPAFVGKDIAAPLFFELIQALKQEKGINLLSEKPMQRLNLKKVNVCKASGMLPTAHCPATESTWFIPGKSPIKTDTIFREIAISGTTGLRTCHIDDSTRFEVFEFWPSDLLAIFKKAGISRHTPPFFESDCALSGASGIAPQIISPQSGVHYVIRASSQTSNQIPLTSITDGGIARLYWFVNEHFLAIKKPDEPLMWQAKPGTFTIRVVDDHGLSDSRTITVVMEN